MIGHVNPALASGVSSVPVLERAMIHEARQYWTNRLDLVRPAQPTCGHVRIKRVPTPAADDPPDTQAYVWMGVGDCTINLVARYWTRRAILGDYPLWCRLMAHEYSHLLGMPDAGSGTMLSHEITMSVPDPYCARP